MVDCVNECCAKKGIHQLNIKNTFYFHVTVKKWSHTIFTNKKILNNLENCYWMMSKEQ